MEQLISDERTETVSEEYKWRLAILPYADLKTFHDLFHVSDAGLAQPVFTPRQLNPEDFDALWELINPGPEYRGTGAREWKAEEAQSDAFPVVKPK